MLDKEKLIILFHVGTCGLSKQNATKNLVEFSNMKQLQFDESVRVIVLPDELAPNNTVRVETINPTRLTDDTYNTKVVPYCKIVKQAVNDYDNNLINE